MHMTVCIYALCVCGQALHCGILEQCYFVCTLQRPWVHLSLEAKSLFALVCFLMAFSQMNDSSLETERKFDPDGLRISSSPYRL